MLLAAFHRSCPWPVEEVGNPKIHFVSSKANTTVLLEYSGAGKRSSALTRIMVCPSTVTCIIVGFRSMRGMIKDPHQMIQTEHMRSNPGYRWCIYIEYQPKSGYAWSGHIRAHRSCASHPICLPTISSSQRLLRGGEEVKGALTGFPSGQYVFS